MEDRILRLIEDNAKANVQQAEALRSLKQSIDKLDAVFRNGFKLELKEQIDESCDEMKQHMDKRIDEIAKPWRWVKLLGTIVVSVCVVVAAVAGVIIKLV